jgi:monoterpene epsilon-lactone hydrolase
MGAGPADEKGDDGEKGPQLKNFKSDLIMANLPPPDDLETWNQLSQQREINRTAGSKGVLDSYEANTTHARTGNANVIDIKPKNWIDTHKVLVYTHGGGYTQLSANSTLGGALAVANITGLRIISIDYTLAPFSKWNKTTDQVISVIRDLKDRQVYSVNNIAMFGDSAGGDITLGSVLKMRDAGIGMPVFKRFI